MIRKLFFLIVSLVFLFFTGSYLYLNSLKPDYSGEIDIQGLSSGTEVYFDSLGIPHIYAKTEKDAYLALGYVHAQDRLFQIEMMRRLASGQLAEVLGPELLETDRFFRTLGIAKHAEESAKLLMTDPNAPWQVAARAYVDGINQYISNGKTPVEFTLLGIPKTNFQLSDIYLVSGYMSFSFALGFRSDPLHEIVRRKYGEAYLNDLAIDPPSSYLKNSVSGKDSIQTKLLTALSKLSEEAIKIMPLPPFVGSNGWAVSGIKSKSGKPILANDAHIAYSQPCVWYEAHIEAPGLSYYGNHVAGFPFGFIGHNRFAAWGLTMLENDDLDYFVEKVNKNNPDEVMYNGEWKKMNIRKEIIKVKGEKDDTLIVKITNHGPVMTGIIKDLDNYKNEVISIWWAYLKFPSRNPEATYKLAHTSSFAESREAVSMIDGPGLNIVYADTTGNIAWWTVGKLIKRPEHVKPGMFLDGSSGKDEPLGFLDFEENPKSENPASGFIFTANQQPEKFANYLHAGYYCPDDRSRRIFELLSADSLWDTEKFKEIQRDVTSGKAMQNAELMSKIMASSSHTKSSKFNASVFELLSTWKGNHHLHSKGPIIYYKFLYHILNNAVADEMGAKEFEVFLNTHTMKNSLEVLLFNEDSPWWDNVSTVGKVENRLDIFESAFNKTVDELKDQLGENLEIWNWGDVHTLVHVHPIGRKKPMHRVFNVGPYEIAGGNETVSNTGFIMNASGKYNVTFGPSKRIVIDMKDIAASQSILPTGQSGVWASPHYSDQALKYSKMEYRSQLMDEMQIKKQSTKLFLKPVN